MHAPEPDLTEQVTLHSRQRQHLLSLQVHLRHLVGGRARSFLGQIPHERIFQVRSPILLLLAPVPQLCWCTVQSCPASTLLSCQGQFDRHLLQLAACRLPN